MAPQKFFFLMKMRRYFSSIVLSLRVSVEWYTCTTARCSTLEFQGPLFCSVSCFVAQLEDIPARAAAARSAWMHARCSVDVDRKVD